MVHLCIWPPVLFKDLRCGLHVCNRGIATDVNILPQESVSRYSRQSSTIKKTNRYVCIWFLQYSQKGSSVHGKEADPQQKFMRINPHVDGNHHVFATLHCLWRWIIRYSSYKEIQRMEGLPLISACISCRFSSLQLSSDVFTPSNLPQILMSYLGNFYRFH